MKTYTILFSKQARKDIDELTPKQKVKLQELLNNAIAVNPYIGKPLKGDLKGLYSYRLNRKDRLVYEIYEEIKLFLLFVPKHTMESRQNRLIKQRSLFC